MRLFAPLVALLVLVAPLSAASPRDELLRLVPEEVGLCLIVQDLRTHWSTLADSPFMAQLQASPLGKALASSPELTQLAGVEKAVAAFLGLRWQQLRDEVLGDALIFAYRPGPPGQPEREQGLFLLHARSADILANLIDRVNKAQLHSGELRKLEEREHQGIKYLCRIERDQPPIYYRLQGSILIGSPQEEMLHRALQLDEEMRPVDVVLPPLAGQLRQLEADKALATLWINPRAFDAELTHKLRTANTAAEAAFLKTFRRYWQALEGVALSLAMGRDLELNLALRLQTEQLPHAARKFLSEAAQPAELWNAFPADALLAVAGRCDIAALLETLGGFLEEKARQELGEALVHGAGPAVAKTIQHLLPCLGPEVGLCIWTPHKDQSLWPEFLWALRVRPQANGKPVEPMLLDALNFFAGLVVLEYNSKHEDRLSLKTAQQGRVEVRYFTNDRRFPAGFQPAYALKDGYLLVASSPAAIQRFHLRPARGDIPAEIPLLRFSGNFWRRYLQEHRTKLLDVLADRNQLTPREAAGQLDRLLMVLHFLEGVALVQRPTAGQVILTLRIQPSAPLRR